MKLKKSCMIDQYEVLKLLFKNIEQYPLSVNFRKGVYLSQIKGSINSNTKC